MKPAVLIVLDGWGHRTDTAHNAVAAAHTPTFDRVWNEYPHCLLQASGEHVGLPDGQMGNSEIGHTTIGAGKIIDTDLVRIAKAIGSGEFAANPALHGLFEHVKARGSTLHLQGLVSPGGVHSHSDHLYALLRAAKEAGVSRVAIHAFTDGRDTPPRSAAAYLKELEKVIAEIGIGHIATVSGRFYAMDRDTNWHRLAKAEAAFFEAEGKQHTGLASEAVAAAYESEGLDEHLEPHIILDDSGGRYPISEDDAVFVFNFRSDRARMLTQKLLERAASMNVPVGTMTEYSADFEVLVAFPPIKIETTLGAEISKAGFTQAHIAETEKFPHATYFLNGGRETPHDGEEHVLLKSRKDVSTHDQAPEMRAEAIADAAVQRLKDGIDFMFINFANPDMVGHTGNKQAIVTAVETVDAELKKVVDETLAAGGVAFVTADHGNAEVNVDPHSGETHTAHTLNPVPFIMVGLEGELRDGSLADIAPTVLQAMEIPQPKSMTGLSLMR